MADEVAIIRIINGDSVGGGNSGGGSPGSGGAGGRPKDPLGGAAMKEQFGGAMSTVLKGLGIASAAALIVGVVSTWKPLINMIELIVKMVGFVLMPIANIVMVLLMPILLMLKPVVQAVNQVMAPFIKNAMEIMKSGAGGGLVGMMAATGAASAVLLTGLVAVIVKLLGMVVEMLFSTIMNLVILIWDAVTPLIEAIIPFSEGLGEEVRAKLIGFRDTGSQLIQDGTNTAVAFLQSGADSITNSFVSSMDKMIGKTQELAREVDNMNVSANRGGNRGSTSTFNEGTGTFNLLTDKDELRARANSGQYKNIGDMLKGIASS